MQILITGGTGFIGTQLCHSLINDSHQLTVLSRRPEKVASLCGNEVKAISQLGELSHSENFDAIINLAGMPIADRRWSSKRKAALESSRIATTAQLITFIENCEHKPQVLISGSAVGFYGDCGDTVIDESSSFHAEFTHELCEHWEQEALKAEAMGIRVCVLRTGLVIGPQGGFVKKMLLPFKLGLGGKLGSGKQWMSWVHRDDLINLMLFLLAHKTAAGIYNGTSPSPVTNEEFTKTLAKVLGRPAFFDLPSSVLQLLMGEMSRLLLTGQRVVPKHAVAEGFQFQYDKLDNALQDVLHHKA